MAEQEQIIPYVPFPEIEKISDKAREYIPKLENASKKAVEQMNEWLQGGELADDEERASLNDFLVKIRENGQKMNTMRMELTRPLDEITKRLIAYEKPLTDDKNSEYTKLRAMVARYDQKKIDKENQIRKEAEDRRKRDDALVEFKTASLRKLAEMLTAKTIKIENGSKDYFAATTLENFEDRMNNYRMTKPKLPPEDYEALMPKSTGILTGEEDKKWIETFRQEENYAKWNETVIAAALPIINIWRAKIPQYKEDLIKIKNADDEAERQRLIDEQQAQAKADEIKRNSIIQQQTLDQSLKIDEQAQLGVIENSFREQAAVQGAPETGPKSYVLKFTEGIPPYKALATIIYHCMAHKKWTGIQRRDSKSKTLVVDANGRPEYIPEVQKWVDFFMDNIDAKIENTEIFEVTKTIIRK